MTELQVLEIKRKRVLSAIEFYRDQLDATGVKLDELQGQLDRINLQIGQLRDNQGVDRPELNREEDGDLVWA